MISVRYHIVSIVAIFLAIGIGILLGSTVLDAAFVSRLESDIERARTLRDEAQRRLSETEALLRLRESQFDQLTALIVGGRLEGAQVVFAAAGEEEAWHAVIREVAEDAGATSAGTLRFSPRWQDEEAGAEIAEVFGEVLPGLELDDFSAGAMRELGEVREEASGRVLVEELAVRGFLTIEGRGEAAVWPPPGAAVVVMASEDEDAGLPAELLAQFAAGAGSGGPAVFLLPDEEGDGADVAVGLDDRTSLSTFVGAAADRGGIGSLLALEAAVLGRGGDFGSGGRPFVAIP